MTSVGFISAKRLLLPRIPPYAALAPSHAAPVLSITVLALSSAVLVLLKPGMEVSLLEREIWKDECFLKPTVKGKFRSRDFTATGAAPLYKIQPG